MMENLLNKLRRGGFRLPLILTIILFSTCGIATYYYLNPPVKLGNLSFFHAYNNDPGYARGYDFFYRIYDTDVIDDNSVSNDAQSFFNETKLLGLLSNDRAIFEDTLYRRLFPISDNISTNYSNPAIPPIMIVDDDYFDRDDSLNRKFEIYFDLNLQTTDDVILSTIDYNPDDPLDDPDPISDYPTTINFGRYVTEDEDGNIFEIVSFSDLNNNQNYDDTPETVLASDTVYICIFVVLYGLIDNIETIFSDVLYIGSEQYTF